jgi:hypothetical protein
LNDKIDNKIQLEKWVESIQINLSNFNHGTEIIT